MAHKMLSILRRLNRIIALLVGVVLLACAGLVIVDITMRKLGASLGGTDEISGYVMAIAVAWGMAYTLLELGHVRIDLLRNRVVSRGRVIFDLIAMLSLAITVSLIAIKGWPVLARSLANSSKANTPLETPLALVQTPWLAGWIWFAIVAWLTFVAAIILLVQKNFSAADEAIGTRGELDSLK